MAETNGENVISVKDRQKALRAHFETPEQNQSPPALTQNKPLLKPVIAHKPTSASSEQSSVGNTDGETVSGTKSLPVKPPIKTVNTKGNIPPKANPAQTLTIDKSTTSSQQASNKSPTTPSKSTTPSSSVGGTGQLMKPKPNQLKPSTSTVNSATPKRLQSPFLASDKTSTDKETIGKTPSTRNTKANDPKISGDSKFCSKPHSSTSTVESSDTDTTTNDCQNNEDQFIPDILTNNAIVQESDKSQPTNRSTNTNQNTLNAVTSSTTTKLERSTSKNQSWLFRNANSTSDEKEDGKSKEKKADKQDNNLIKDAKTPSKESDSSISFYSTEKAVAENMSSPKYKLLPLPASVTGKPPRKPAKPPNVCLSKFLEDVEEVYEEELYENENQSTSNTADCKRLLSNVSQISELAEDEEEQFQKGVAQSIQQKHVLKTVERPLSEEVYDDVAVVSANNDYQDDEIYAEID